jgi:hypothetical protein
MVKSKLQIDEETLIVRFPKQIEYLIDSNNYVRTPIKLTTLRRSKLTTCSAGEEKGFTHVESGV